ncbi:MAG: NAD(P)H-hydrate dehydratase [Bacteroidota bacterium]|nr:NAD(P)H-hydrate dehydratase [Bacteroidota bacterium]
MIEIFSPQQMKKTDEFAINKLGVPSLTLMENSGCCVADEIQRQLTVKNKNVVVFCGIGNNGGDGFVVARILQERDAIVTVVMMGKPSAMSEDAKHTFGRLSKQIRVVQCDDFFKETKIYHVIVDAMFGTSFHGALNGTYFQAAQWINVQKKATVVAVDIPSGLNGESGEVEAEAVKAHFTVTLSHPKLGFYQRRAKEYTGNIIVTDIGIPAKASNRVSSNIFLVEESDVKEIIPTRHSNSHKHSVGKIFILAGSKGMTGAALLSSQSAMRSGAGQVILGIPESEYPIVAKRTLEVMPLGLPSTDEGTLALGAKKEIEKRIQWADVVLLGCGVSQNKETQQLVRDVLTTCSKPIVIDADGLNAIANDNRILKRWKSKQIVLTPHVGEFSRLSGISSSEIEKNKFSLAGQFAEQYNVTLVLKGAPTIIATSSRDIFVNPTGNPGMSTAGTGDVLAGIIASMMGQQLSGMAAAVCGVYLHGKAGDVAAKKIGMHGIIAGDLIKFLPTIMRTIVQ